MRSRDSAVRLPFETVVRAAALLALVAALWRAFAAATDDGPPRAQVALGTGVSPVARDSLAALARAGVDVTWGGDLRPVAAMAEPVREPEPGWRVSIVAPDPTLLRDELGVIDSLAAGGGAVRIAGVRGALGVRAGATTALVVAPPSPALRRVLVYGRAGWESKFVIAALEEAGWAVDARLRLADTLFTTQGRPAVPDLARHAVVVVLDTAVGRFGTAITRFVRAGGGLVLAGEGADVPLLRPLAPARVARIEAPESRSFEGVEPLHALPRHVLASPLVDAAPIALHDGAPAILARRVGSGRVVQSSYAETWRWRMQAEGRSVEEHRAFWTRLVGAAARAEFGEEKAADAPSAPTDTVHAMPSPLAEVTQALGAPSAALTDAPPPPSGPALPWWLGAGALLLLVAEWAARRMRGAP